MSQDEFNTEVPINDEDGKTENDYTCQYDYMDQDRFEVDMLPSLVNKIIGNCNSSKCIIFTDFGTRVRRVFNWNNAAYLTEQDFLQEIPIQRRYSKCSVIFSKIKY